MENTNNSEISLIEKIFLILLCIAFTTIDWNVGLITFSDIILIFLLTLVLFTRNIIVKKTDFKIFLLILGLLLANVLYHYFFSNINTNASVAALIRISFYLVFIIVSYNFILFNNLKTHLLFFLNLVAMAAVLIGVYISVVIFFDLDLPYEFFWIFTRNDPNSYIFRGTQNLIRARSVFAEPSHYGYFLNTVFGLNLFSNEKVNHSKWFNLVLIFALISTLSYSTLLITAVLMTTYIVKIIMNDKSILTKRSTIIGVIIGLLLIVLFSYLFWDIIYATVIKRTMEIYMGYDTSAINRLMGSWAYVPQDTFLFGNGLGQTPIIFNNYAYILSDIGLVAFVGSVAFTIFLIKMNFGLGILFILLNFQKGGYLSPSFWILLLLTITYSLRKKPEDYELLIGREDYA